MKFANATQGLVLMNRNQPHSIRVLAVDDEQDILDAYQDVLSPQAQLKRTEVEMQSLATKLFGDPAPSRSVPSFELVTCRQGDDAQQAVKNALAEGRPFAVAFIDIRLPPGPDGVWTAENIRLLDPYTEIVMVTAYSDVDPSDVAARVQPEDKLLYIQKPFHPREIRQFAVALSAKWEAERLLRDTRDALEEQVNKRTEALREAKKQLEKEIDQRKAAHTELNQVFNVAVPLCVIDTGFNMVRVNDSFCSFFRTTLHDVLNKKCHGVLHGPMCGTKRCPMTAILNGGKRSAHEEEKRLADGQTITCVVTAVPLLGSDGILFGIVENFTDITERKKSEQSLRKREEQLALKSRHLEETNTALRVLLRQRDEQKAEIEEKVLSNVKELVIPHLESLRKTGLDAMQLEHVDVLQANLLELTSPFSQKLSAAYIKLTPREMQVANLVKAGKTSREMAQLLNISINAIVFHRYNIREKLGLKNQKTNLRSYLLSLP
jgi:PAS domain S-box-containing protein